MASRSFKPASYLASAAQAQQKPSRSPRPSFARTSSSSSNLSTKSDDSFIATLRSLNTNTNSATEGSTAFASSKENERNSGGASSPRIIAPGSPVSRQSKFDDTPSRKRSKPIAIELPARNTATAYTPLTGRGDHHKGGYFPEYEDFSKTYKERSFTRSGGSSTPGSPSNMSASSSVMSSPTEVTPKGPTSVLTPLLNPTAPIIDALGIPAGKYYPSNYNSPATTRLSTPTSAASLPPTNLTIPSATTLKTKRQKSGHERDSSDVKRKLQQYQRDMIAQARFATSHTKHGLQLQMPKPLSPKLMPAGSPGPITPFELEQESAGYLTRGSRPRSNSLIGNGLEKEKERQLVEDIISVEKGRAMEIEHRGYIN